MSGCAEKDENGAKICHSGDAIEANAIKSVFSDHATSGSLALSSTKVKFSFYFVFSSTFFKLKKFSWPNL